MGVSAEGSWGLHSLRTSRIVIFYQIHPAANFIPPHQLGIKRLQQVAHSVRLLEAGVEPQVVSIVRQDDGHAVVDVGKERIRGRGDDGAGLDRLPFRVAP